MYRIGRILLQKNYSTIEEAQCCEWEKTIQQMEEFNNYLKKWSDLERISNKYTLFKHSER